MQHVNAEKFAIIFAELLKEQRKKLGISHETLAERSGLTRQAIGRIESATNPPTLYTFYKISRGLELSLQDLTKLFEAKLKKTQKD